MASIAPSPDPSLDAEWEEWKMKYEKTYCQDEEKYRRTLWEEEKKKIDEHNAEYGQDQTGIYANLNEFSDMTYEEFRKVCCGNLMWAEEDLDCDKHECKDLTKDNNVTPEKDQEPSASRSDPCDDDKAEQGKNRRRNSRAPLQYRG